MGWMVIIGYWLSKSTFGANNVPYFIPGVLCKILVGIFFRVNCNHFLGNICSWLIVIIFWEIVVLAPSLATCGRQLPTNHPVAALALTTRVSKILTCKQSWQILKIPTSRVDKILKIPTSRVGKILKILTSRVGKILEILTTTNFPREIWSGSKDKGSTAERAICPRGPRSHCPRDCAPRACQTKLLVGSFGCTGRV